MSGIGKGASGPLPSKHIYDKFDEGRRGRCMFGEGKRKDPSDLEGEVKNSLFSYGGSTWDVASKIANNYCSVCNRGGRVDWLNTLGDDDRCYFFYYWLGDKVKENFKGFSLSMVMNAIYKKLTEFDLTCKCTNLYGGLKEDRFKQAKELFDYNYNYKELRKNEEECYKYCSGDKCKHPWDTLYREAESTYNAVSKYCGSSSGDTYCTKFNDKEGKRGEYNKPQELKCSTTTNQVSVKSPTALPSATPQGKGDSITLPSELEYSAFDRRNYCTEVRGKEQHCNQDLKEKVEATLKRWENAGSLAGGIVSNYDYACTVKSTLQYYDPCKFLYFWIGDRIKDKFSTRNQFSPLMREIYKTLKDSTSTCTCSNIYDNITKDRFPEAKILFDYYYNYKELHNKQKCSEYCTNGKCGEAYSTADSTYTQVSQSCRSTLGDPYCEKFDKTLKGKDEYGEPQKLECPPVAVKPATAANPVAAKPAAVRPPAAGTREGVLSTPSAGLGRSADSGLFPRKESVTGDEGGAQNQGKKAEGAQSQPLQQQQQLQQQPQPPQLPGPAAPTSSEGINSTTTTNIGIGGGAAAAATIALPAIALFLYKYDLLPSGIKNMFFGNNSSNRNKRGKRSTIRQRIDTLTDDDTSIEYSTVGSTTGSITNPSEYSVPYVR